MIIVFLKSGLNIQLCAYFASRSVMVAVLRLPPLTSNENQGIATFVYLLLSVIFSSKVFTYPMGGRHSHNNIPAISSTIVVF